MKPIGDVARAIGIDPAVLEPYGHYKAKLPLSAFMGRPNRGKLVLVSAITPTPAGRGQDHHDHRPGAGPDEDRCAQCGGLA